MPSRAPARAGIGTFSEPQLRKLPGARRTEFGLLLSFLVLLLLSSSSTSSKMKRVSISSWVNPQEQDAEWAACDYTLVCYNLLTACLACCSHSLQVMKIRAWNSNHFDCELVDWMEVEVRASQTIGDLLDYVCCALFVFSNVNVAACVVVGIPRDLLYFVVSSSRV